ncbi:MAG: hypothetical protein N2560_07160 [Ignavibacteria bacterium]|nr:hypothetical protein [Ignavibacteria bacterium]
MIFFLAILVDFIFNLWEVTMSTFNFLPSFFKTKGWKIVVSLLLSADQ